MAEYPALMLWTDAYLADAYHLTTEEHGAYFLMLMACWRTPECRLRDDDRFLARVTKSTHKRWVERLRPSMLRFWIVKNGYWTQKRLLKEREKAEVICAKRSRAANARWKDKSLKHNGPGDAHACAHADAHAMQRARATPHPIDSKLPLQTQSPIGYPPLPLQTQIKKSESVSEGTPPRGCTVHQLTLVTQEKPKAKATRMPDDWDPGDEGREWARTEFTDPILSTAIIEEETEKCRDWAWSTSGQKAVKVNWNRFWKNWVRTAHGRLQAEARRERAYRERWQQSRR
jgi:uncharacterized protein YdaU (DUF1376 family)